VCARPGTRRRRLQEGSRTCLGGVLEGRALKEAPAPSARNFASSRSYASSPRTCTSTCHGRVSDVSRKCRVSPTASRLAMVGLRLAAARLQRALERVDRSEADPPDRRSAYPRGSSRVSSAPVSSGRSCRAHAAPDAIAVLTATGSAAVAPVPEARVGEKRELCALGARLDGRGCEPWRP